MLPAAVLPIGLIGVGMMILNARRFGSPFEFGVPYLLTGINVHQSPPLITGRYIGYNLRVYFLEPVLWSMRSVFPIGIRLPTEPMPGYVGTENPFGILTSVPFVWLAGLAAFAGRGLAGEARLRLRWIIGCMLALHFCSLATVCAVAASCTRYEADFLPQLMLLASLGLLVLERMLVGHRMWRVVARCIWGLLLCYSSIVGALVGASANSVYVGMRDLHMLALATEGHSTEPLAWVETAARRYSDRAMPFIHRLGETYFQQNRLPEAAACFERLVQIEPSADYADAQNFLGFIFYRQGRMEDARKHFLRALELNPDYRVAAENLAKLAPKSDPLPERR